MTHICLIEDEVDLAAVLNDYLIAAGFTTTVLHDGLTASEWLRNQSTDLVLLDLMLPGKDGLEIYKDFRKHSDDPVIMLTAKVEEIDRLIGLELGADDYICKPYSPREVVARVKTVLRRSSLIENKPGQHAITVNQDTNNICLGESGIEVTTIELKLFELLHSQPGRIFSRQYILDNIYNDYRIVSDRTVDSHIKKLRKKLHQLAANIEFIHSVYGAGYKFEPVYERLSSS